MPAPSGVEAKKPDWPGAGSPRQAQPQPKDWNRRHGGGRQDQQTVQAPVPVPVPAPQRQVASPQAQTPAQAPAPQQPQPQESRQRGDWHGNGNGRGGDNGNGRGNHGRGSHGDGGGSGSGSGSGNSDGGPKAPPVTGTPGQDSAGQTPPAEAATAQPPAAPSAAPPAAPAPASPQPQMPKASRGKHQSRGVTRAPRSRPRPAHGLPGVNGRGALGTPSPALTTLSQPRPVAQAGSAQKRSGSNKKASSGNDAPSVVERTVRKIVEVVPGPVKALIAALAGLFLMSGFGWLLVTLRARGLARQRAHLLGEVGLLQTALLPEVPAQIGALGVSVAYRPADGPGAGGDFYDAFPMEGGLVGIVIGDVAGHGRDALARTALLRYTLRAYLETGLEPRKALQIAGRILEEDLDAGFATAAVGVYDPRAGTLAYSCAGHPPPIVLGTHPHDAVTVASSPPLGAGEPTGLRQTTVPLPPGTLACFFTDGLAEARVDGALLGRERLADMIASLGDEPTAADLLRTLRATGHVPDDMAACILAPAAEAGASAGDGTRLEEIELHPGHERARMVGRFLLDCGVPADEAERQVRIAATEAQLHGGAILRVRSDDEGTRVSVALPVIELIEAYSRRQLAN